MKVWITKYALTTGILERDAETVESTTGMIRVMATGDTFSQYFHGEGRDWHRTYASAAKKAEKMRDAKIASLRKQIAKLSNMTWPI